VATRLLVRYGLVLIRFHEWKPRRRWSVAHLSKTFTVLTPSLFVYAQWIKGWWQEWRTCYRASRCAREDDGSRSLPIARTRPFSAPCGWGSDVVLLVRTGWKEIAG